MGDSLAHWLKIQLSTANIRSGLVLNLEFKEEVEIRIFLTWTKNFKYFERAPPISLDILVK